MPTQNMSKEVNVIIEFGDMRIIHKYIHTLTHTPKSGAMTITRVSLTAEA